MSDAVNPKLVEQMRGFAAKGLTYEDAQAGLMNAGWTAAEVEEAKKHARFKVHAEAKTQPAHSSKSIDADKAASIALSNAKARDTDERLRDETALAGLVGDSRAPYTAQYQNTFFENLGLSWFKVAGLFVGAYVILGVLRAPGWLIQGLSAGLFIFIVYVFYERFLAGRR